MKYPARHLVPVALIAGIAMPVAWTLSSSPAPAPTQKPQGRGSSSAIHTSSLTNTFEGEPVSGSTPLEDFRTRATKDPAAAALWLAEQSGLSQDPAWLEQLVIAWSSHDATAALDWARSQPGELQAPLLLAIAGQLVTRDPQQALQISLQLSPSPLRDDVLARSLAIWAADDAAASERWLLSLEDITLQKTLRPILILQLASNDPAAAVALARQDLSVGRSREDTLARVFLAWTEQDPAAALAGASALDNPAERDQAIAGVCARISQDNPSAAIRTLVSQGVADSCPDVLQQLAARWLAVDESEAIEWINLQPEGEIRDLLMKQMAIARSQSDPAGAAQLIANRIPPGPVQDEAALSILRHWAIRDPRAASIWLATFPESEFHRSAVRELGEIASRR